MSVPGNINPAPPPSSFDNDAEFYEESRFKKLGRRLTEEPLIPLGCALTSWALYEAAKASRSGDKYKTNRMFRRRIYAQGFTIIAMLAGSIYWESDRKRRRQYDGLVEEKKKKEKHESWLRELEARDEEEQELRKIRDKIMKSSAKERREYMDGATKGSQGSVKSVCEQGEGRGMVGVVEAVRALWEARR